MFLIVYLRFQDFIFSVKNGHIEEKNEKSTENDAFIRMEGAPFCLKGCATRDAVELNPGSEAEGNYNA